MRFTAAIALLSLIANLAMAPLHAQNVEVSGWRPSDWRLVATPTGTEAADDRNVSTTASASRPLALDGGSNAAWVRWGVDEPTAAVSSLDGSISLRAAGNALPERCALGAGNVPNVRAYSAECVAAAALANAREAEARASLEWNSGPFALTASMGSGAALLPLTESFNPLGSLPAWLLDDALRGDNGLSVAGLAGGGVTTRSRDVALRGDWQVSSAVSVHLLGSRGDLTVSASPSGASPARVDAQQTVLGFGITRGSLSGVVTGQRIEPTSPLRADESVTAIDLGVSWRTPWQGELTLGARELSRSSAPLADPAQAAKALEDRTPYVQYRQDL